MWLQTLQRYGVTDAVGAHAFYDHISDVLAAYQSERRIKLTCPMKNSQVWRLHPICRT